METPTSQEIKPTLHISNAEPDSETKVETYVRALLWPVTVASIFQISGITNENQSLIVIAAHLALTVYVVAIALKRKASWQTTAVVAGIAGGASMLVTALFALIVDFSVVRIFALFTQTAIASAVDMILAGFLMSLAQLVYEKKGLKNLTQEEGGEENG